jgi:hypothetical protein
MEARIKVQDSTYGGHLQKHASTKCMTVKKIILHCLEKFAYYYNLPFFLGLLGLVTYSKLISTLFGPQVLFKKFSLLI